MAEESNLVKHARRELEMVGEEPEVIDWYCRVIGEFASFGHSGTSAEITTQVISALLRFQNLTELTNDPVEWNYVSGPTGEDAIWQSRRNPEAFSTDGGKTHYLLSETEEMGQRVIHISKEIV
jgi:hypothetical protein